MSQMKDRLPIKAARDVAIFYKLRQVILLGWDGSLTHIVTFGKSVEDCSQAADGGNMLKVKWGWPECNDQPSRVKKLEARIKLLETRARNLVEAARLSSAVEFSAALTSLESALGEK